MHSWAASLFGFRLIALAVVSAAVVFSPGDAEAGKLLWVIAAGVVLATVQFMGLQAGRRMPDELIIVAFVGLWTMLVHLTHGSESPFFIGYLLEVPLAAFRIGRRGAILAAIAGAAAFTGYQAVVQGGVVPGQLVPVAGFLGAVTILTCVVADVLKRQRAEIESSHAALRGRAESLSEQLRLLGDYLQDAVLVIDDLGRVESVNMAGAALCEVERTAVAGRAWQDVLRVDGDGVRAITRTLAEGIEQRNVPIVLRDTEGKLMSVHADLWVGATAGRIRTYVLLDSHRSESMEADPLSRLGGAIACVSHQIKNSIHALQGLAGSMKGQSDSDSMIELRSALRGLGTLAEGLLAASGAVRARDESIPLADIVASAIVLSRRSAVPIQIIDECPGLSVRGHRGELIHALFNLIDNAGHASPSGASVRVRLRANGEFGVVDIEDEGPGMPPHVEAARGFVASRSGSGYGLVAARRFVESNAGEISFARLPGAGMRCSVQFAIPSAPVRSIPALATAAREA